MRLWSIHPKYLDRAGLVALWREGLLAQAVLLGKTKGYRHHPQLERFSDQPDPAGSIAAYLRVVHAEGRRRGYRFDGRKLGKQRKVRRVPVPVGQIAYEWGLLKRKLQQRNFPRYEMVAPIQAPETHPIFRAVPGPLASWERLKRLEEKRPL